jgi:hypothetical protein
MGNPVSARNSRKGHAQSELPMHWKDKDAVFHMVEIIK